MTKLSRLLLGISTLVAGLESIKYKDLQTLALTEVSKSSTLSSLDKAHIILLADDKACSNPTCVRYEQTLEQLQSRLTERASADLGANLTFFKTYDESQDAPGGASPGGPGIAVLRGPWLYDYNDDLVEEKVYEFLRSHLRSVMTEFNSTDEADKWLNAASERTDRVRFLIEGDQEARDNFELVAGGEIEFAEYGFVKSASHKRVRLQKWELVKEFDNFDFTDHQGIYKLIMNNHQPVLATLDSIPKIRYYFTTAKKGFAWLIYSDDLHKANKRVVEPLREVLRTYVDRLHFIHIDPSLATHYKDFIIQVLKIKPDAAAAATGAPSPTFVVTDVNSAPGRYVYDQFDLWREKELNAWFKKLFNNELKVELASEAVPKSDADRRVRVIGLKKLVSAEYADTFLPAQKDSYLVVVPSVLCDQEICEQALQTLKKADELTQKNSDALRCGDSHVQIRFTDGQKNEFDKAWDLDITHMPPVWLFRSHPQKAFKSIDEVEKTHLVAENLKSVDTLRAWLAEQCSVNKDEL